MQRIEINGSGEVATGEAFEVAVASGLATGATLTVDAPAGVTLLGKEGSTPRAFGAQARTVYRFSCQTPGEYKIYFRRQRPWETVHETSEIRVRCHSV